MRLICSMNEWCVNQHGKSGLTAACLASEHTYEDVTKKVLEYIQRWVPEKGASLLAGSSVHADMRWVQARHSDAHHSCLGSSSKGCRRSCSISRIGSSVGPRRPYWSLTPRCLVGQGWRRTVIPVVSQSDK